MVVWWCAQHVTQLSSDAVHLYTTYCLCSFAWAFQSLYQQSNMTHLFRSTHLERMLKWLLSFMDETVSSSLCSIITYWGVCSICYSIFHRYVSSKLVTEPNLAILEFKRRIYNAVLFIFSVWNLPWNKLYEYFGIMLQLRVSLCSSYTLWSLSILRDQIMMLENL